MNESNEPKLCVENGKYSDSDNDNDRPKSNLNIIKMQACIALEKSYAMGQMVWSWRLHAAIGEWGSEIGVDLAPWETAINVALD